MLLTYITPNVGLPVLKPDGTTALDVVFQALTNITAPNNYLWDFNGDGTGDLQCTVSPVATGRFATQGIYLPTVTLTDAQGKQYKDTTIVNVMNKEDMGAMFKMIWTGRLMTRLLSGNIDAAMEDVLTENRDKYRRITAQIGTNKIQQIYDNTVDITLDGKSANTMSNAVLSCNNPMDSIPIRCCT